MGKRLFAIIAAFASGAFAVFVWLSDAFGVAELVGTAFGQDGWLTMLFAELESNSYWIVPLFGLLSLVSLFLAYRIKDRCGQHWSHYASDKSAKDMKAAIPVSLGQVSVTGTDEKGYKLHFNFQIFNGSTFHLRFIELSSNVIELRRNDDSVVHVLRGTINAQKLASVKHAQRKDFSVSFDLTNEHREAITSIANESFSFYGKNRCAGSFYFGEFGLVFDTHEGWGRFTLPVASVRMNEAKRLGLGHFMSLPDDYKLHAKENG